MRCYCFLAEAVVLVFGVMDQIGLDKLGMIVLFPYEYLFGELFEGLGALAACPFDLLVETKDLFVHIRHEVIF